MEKQNKFVQAMAKEVAWKETENGQTALNTTFDACLDLFSTIGALRKRTDGDIEAKIGAAYAEDKLVCMKIVFYARDIEEGLGERRVFRVALKYLAQRHRNDVIVNIPNIVKYGRFDDLYELVGTPVEKEAFKFMKLVFEEDYKNFREKKPLSLAAKWLKSVNTSSKESRRLGQLTAKYFGLTEREYRTKLSALRKALKIVENDMSHNEWGAIDFNKVPGGAMKKYYKAFGVHEPERFKEYVDALHTGKKIVVNGKEVEAKINTKKLYPYEILEQYSHGTFYLGSYKYNPAIEAMWNGLKDWLEDASENTIVIADTSYSMSGRPMATSVGLGIYFAQHNKGAFHNKFMTFSRRPSWIQLSEGTALCDQIAKVPDICDNTNLEAAFDLILNTAIQNNLSQKDMPKNLVIITDMEFDTCVVDNACKYSHTRMTFYDAMKAKYELHGYKLPEITFWNVDARQDTFHTTKNQPHVRMVSGQATSVFKSLIDGKTHTPYEFMLETINVARYESVLVAK